MTNREAINLLEEVRVLDDSIYAYNKAYSEALEMALTALEAEEAWYVSHEYPHKEQWTPVTERLPKKSGDYYVTWEAVKGGKRTVEKMRFRQYLDGFGSAINHILAWMPPPDPWEGEANDAKS